ncbi:hypothetical protein SAMN02745244_03672 [Tessaracoccus bendigoensis DSM 12906]|uniref:Uncharacterized protein n=1 Tax=Tessaracoccus bendigoensis DSM 12906 TaxID=1123357 RepID=A0A1M6NM82_9ACTN|nr:hypothetical protein SAMN02745244_03672 [Tessaracoccus bendigoensis DSM 12906]
MGTPGRWPGARHQRSGADTCAKARHHRYTAGVQQYRWYRPQTAGVHDHHHHLAARRTSTAAPTVTKSGAAATPAERLVTWLPGPSRGHLRQFMNGRFGSRRRTSGSPRRSGCLAKAGFPLRPFVEALTPSGVLGPKPDAERITAIAHAIVADGHESFARPSAPSPDKPRRRSQRRRGSPETPSRRPNHARDTGSPHSGTSALHERNIHSRPGSTAAWPGSSAARSGSTAARLGSSAARSGSSNSGARSASPALLWRGY